MKHLLTVLIALCAFTASAADTRYYEIRTYFPAAGKMEDLHKRFRDHTVRLFAKHGMEQIGYWVPTNQPNEKLVFLLAYPSKEAREASWKAFMDDPEWKKAYEASHANGVLVERMTSVFYQAVDYSPVVKATKTGSKRLFELRTYTAAEGRLGALNERFRDHTLKLFSKHGFENLVYLVPATGQPGDADTLLYFLGHKDADSAKAGWDGFRRDPDWTPALRASEAKAGGSLTARGGVKSEFFQATDYSPTQ